MKEIKIKINTVSMWQTYRK